MPAAVLVSIINSAGLIAVALISLAGRRQRARIESKVEDVAAELATGNGHTVGRLVATLEGHHLEATVPRPDESAG
jgi:hypothetical protein